MRLLDRDGTVLFFKLVIVVLILCFVTLFGVPDELFKFVEGEGGAIDRGRNEGEEVGLFGLFAWPKGAGALEDGMDIGR